MPSGSRTKRRIRTIGIVIKPQPPRATAILRQISRWLRRRGIEVCFDPQTAALMPRRTEALDRATLASRCDAIVVIGGDGTLLAVAREMGASRTPILGVNMGSLGFLTEVPLDEMRASLDAVLEGRHRIARRNRLQVEIMRGKRIIARHHALNDVVIAKSALARILDINVEMDGRFTTIFRADGLIVATPTGSTAYSLSAGGPIVDPSVDAVLLCPICPHTLTNRPIVAPGVSRVGVGVVRNHGEVYITVDGQVGSPFAPGDHLRIRKSPHPVRLIHFADRDYFDVLRRKLKWSGRVQLTGRHSSQGSTSGP